MLPFLPDPLAIHVIWRGDGEPYDLDLTLPDGRHTWGTLDLAALRGKLESLEQVWLSGEPDTYGACLFEHLFPGALRDAHAGVCRAAGSRGVRILLTLDRRSPPLHAVPWERLYQPEGTGWTPVAAAPGVVFSRLLETDHPWQFPTAPGPLRLLLAIANPYPPGHRYHFDAQAERAVIDRACKPYADQLTVEALPGPVTLDRLVAQLRDGPGYDILYYCGHGIGAEDAVPEAGGRAALLMEEVAGSGVRPVEVCLEQFRTCMQQVSRKPSLVFLAACHSAQVSTRQALLGFGPQLVMDGCPAVICMQDRIEDVIGQPFAEKFFGELLKGGCVDLAVNRGRAAVFEAHSWQWAVPVLFMHLDHGMLFWPQARFPPAERQPYRPLKSFGPEDADLFAGRNEEVEEICQSVGRQPLTVVYGADGIGLTSLVEAGVRPRLEGRQDLVIVVSDYSSLASEVRLKLWESRLRLRTPLPGDAPLPDVLAAAPAAGEFRRLILVLDQFEWALRLSQEDQRALRASLVESLQRLLSLLRIVIVVHDAWLGDLAAWQAEMSQLVSRWIPLGPLSTSAAADAILKPLRQLRWPVEVPDQNLVTVTLPADLAAVYRAGQGPRETPGSLRALAPEPRPGMGGAAAILPGQIEEVLRSGFDGDADLARRILVALAGPQGGRWTPLSRIVPETGERARLVPIVDRLVQTGCLYRRPAGAEEEYALAFQAPMVHPAQLQMVCEWLYEQAGRPENRGCISPDLYRAAGGAEGILYRTVQDLLKTYCADEAELAQQVLISLAGPGAGRWLPLGGIAPEVADRARLERAADRLVDYGCLDRRRIGTEAQYGFANQAVARQAVELGGETLRRRYDAEGEVERIWRMWLVLDGPATGRSPDDRSLASVAQLRGLEMSAEHLQPPPNRALLLLRSALAHDRPVGRWLAWLRGAPDEINPIRAIEEQRAPAAEMPADSGLPIVGRLLGLDDLPPADAAAAEAQAFGPLARSAVAHENPLSRSTAALALAATLRDAGARLDEAYNAWVADPQRHGRAAWRAAEINGLLLDAGMTAGLAGGRGGQGRGGRFQTWCWRARRRVIRHRYRLFALVAGAALGMGLTLGAWIALLAWFGNFTNTPGAYFASYSWLGILLGAAIGLGIALAQPLLLEDSADPGAGPPRWRRPWRPAWLPELAAVGLGTLAFGLLHAFLVVLVALGGGESLSPALIPLGSLAGLALCLGLYGQPRAGLRMGWAGWTARLGTAAILMAANQILAILAGGGFGAGAASIGANFSAPGERLKGFMIYVPIRDLFEAHPALPDQVAVLNAALLGILLVIGCTVGMAIALRRLVRSNDRIVHDSSKEVTR